MMNHERMTNDDLRGWLDAERQGEAWQGDERALVRALIRMAALEIHLRRVAWRRQARRFDMGYRMGRTAGLGIAGSIGHLGFSIVLVALGQTALGALVFFWACYSLERAWSDWKKAEAIAALSEALFDLHEGPSPFHPGQPFGPGRDPFRGP